MTVVTEGAALAGIERQRRLVASGIGARAASRLVDGSRGRVIAVFARGIHLLFDDDLVVTVGLAALGAGPLNLLVDARDGHALASLARGAEAKLRGSTLHLGAARIDWRDAPRYRTPPPPPAPPDDAALHDARARLGALGTAPAGGFAWRLPTPSSGTTAATLGMALDTMRGRACQQALHDTVRPALAALDGWLAETLDDALEGSPDPAPHDVVGLLGAGPGLTPAGDDLLAGALLALHRLHRADAARTLWRALAPALAARTHPFAAAQLALAAEGECAARVVGLLDDLFDTSDAASSGVLLASRLDAIGASSGRDLAAGIAAVIDARLAAGAGVAASERRGASWHTLPPGEPPEPTAC